MPAKNRPPPPKKENMIWLGYDIETTGLNVETDRVTEVGFVLWDAYKKKTIYAGSKLVSNRIISKEIEQLTGIDQHMIDKFGENEVSVFNLVQDYMNQADYIISHNGNLYDKPLTFNEFKRNSIEPPNKPWIDTTTDVPFDPKITTRSLKYLASEKEFVNPFPHRALFDVLTMLKIVSYFDPDVIRDHSLAKTFLIKALVTRDNKELAKSRGYRWNPEKVSWYKTIKEFNYEKECLEAPFKVLIVEEIK
jgi:DNA polymerase III subunit epsilon